MKVRILHTFPLLLLPCFTPAQNKPSDWKKSNLAPLEYAKRIDQGIFNLKNALGEARYKCEFFNGAYGGAFFENRIRDRKTFRVMFGKVAEGTKDPFTQQTVIGKNGTLHLLSVATGYKPLRAGVNPGLIPTNVSSVDAWPRHFQQAMFQPYITGKGAFQPFVQGLLKGDGSYTVKIESRVMQGTKRSIPQLRIFAKRTPAAAKKLGDATIEIVTDANMYLPLQVRVNLTNLKKKKAIFEWTSDWKGGLRFDEKWFTIPKIVATK